MAKVQSLRPANDAPGVEVERIPGFIIEVTANFADQQQVRLHMPVKDAVSIEEADRYLDVLVGRAQRQVSLMEIRLNLAALADKKRALERQEKLKLEEEEKHAKQLEEIEREIVRLTEKRESAEQADRIRHGNERAGEWKAQGAVKNRLDALDRDIAAQRDKVKSAEADYQQKVLRAQDDMIERLSEEIAAIGRVIEKHRAVVEGREIAG